MRSGIATFVTDEGSRPDRFGRRNTLPAVLNSCRTAATRAVR
jgi:hypothetical protein